MTQADSVHSTPRTDSSSSDLQFRSIEDAENFLKSQGFWLVANTCDWTNIDGDDAGVYSVDGYWGEVKAWRVEINKRTSGAPKPAEDLSRRALLQGLGAYPVVAGALAASTATAGCTITSTLLADADPIFAAIEAHKQAMANTDAAFERVSEVGREADKAGLRHEILVPDYRNGACGNTYERRFVSRTSTSSSPRTMRSCGDPMLPVWGGRSTSGMPSRSPSLATTPTILWGR